MGKVVKGAREEEDRREGDRDERERESRIACEFWFIGIAD